MPFANVERTIAVGLIGLAAINAQTQAAELFLGRRALPISYRPSAVELADLDADGDADLVAACAGEFAADQWNGSVVHVFENIGDSEFSDPVTYVVPDAPYGLAVADLNGDFAPDLVTPNAAPDNLQILLNDGAGAFNFGDIVPVSVDPVAVVAADFDGDIDLDLASADQFGFGVTIAFNDGAAHFPTTTFKSAGDLINGIQAGDTDLDGDVDLVVFLNGGPRLMRNQGSGTFTNPIQLGLGAVDPRSRLALLDGDDFLDLVSAEKVWFGTGTGVFDPAGLTTGLLTDHVRCLDFNSDGFNDVVSGRGAALSDGNGQFSELIDFDAAPDSGPIAALDWTSDGIPDLVRAQAGIAGPEAFAVLLPGLGGGEVAGFPRVACGDSVWSLAADNLNGDGHIDAAVANIGTPFGQFKNGSVNVLLGNGDGTMQPTTAFPAGDYVRTVTLAEFDEQDGLDAVVANFNDAGINLLYNDGSGNLSAPTELATGNNPEAVATADFDLDGHQDLAVANYGLGATKASLSILFGDGLGGVASSQTINLTGHAAVGLVASHLNADDAPDLAVVCAGRFFNSNWIDFGLYVLINNGDGTFGAEEKYSPNRLPRAVVATDIDNDGDLDLAVTAHGPVEDLLFVGEVVAFFNDGAGAFSSSVATATTEDHFAARAADLNDDDFPDLVIPYLSADVVCIRWGDGAGGFSDRLCYATGSEPRGLAIRDFNGDGGNDLAIAHSDINELGLILAAPSALPCDGDVNADGNVDPLDSGFVLARFGCPVGTGDPACDAADANADGIVDPLDVGFVLSRFGECR